MLHTNHLLNNQKVSKTAFLLLDWGGGGLEVVFKNRPFLDKKTVTPTKHSDWGRRFLYVHPNAGTVIHCLETAKMHQNLYGPKHVWQLIVYKHNWKETKLGPLIFYKQGLNVWAKLLFTSNYSVVWKYYKNVFTIKSAREQWILLNCKI